MLSGFFGLFRNRFGGARCRWPIRVCGGADASIGKFNGKMRTGSDRGGGVYGEALLVADQREPTGQHAAIGQRGQQLPAMRDPRLMTLHRGDQRAPGTLGQPQRPFAVARDGLALHLRVGKL